MQGHNRSPYNHTLYNTEYTGISKEKEDIIVCSGSKYIALSTKNKAIILSQVLYLQLIQEPLTWRHKHVTVPSLWISLPMITSLALCTLLYFVNADEIMPSQLLQNGVYVWHEGNHGIFHKKIGINICNGVNTWRHEQYLPHLQAMLRSTSYLSKTSVLVITLTLVPVD